MSNRLEEIIEKVDRVCRPSMADAVWLIKEVERLREAFQQRIDNAQATIEEGHYLDWSAQKVEALLNGFRDTLATKEAFNEPT